MKAATLMREMKWTWQEYRSQPLWLIALLHSLIKNEAEEVHRRSKAE